MRIQPRHLAPGQGNLSRKQSTSNTQAGLQCKPGGPLPCALPQLAEGQPQSSPLMAVTLPQGPGGAARPKVLNKEETQAGGHSWGGSLHSLIPQKTAEKRGREATSPF